MSIQGIYFLDIETVPDMRVQMPALKLYAKKNNLIVGELSTIEHFKQNAGLSAEFGKIVGISLGVMKATTTGDKFFIKSITGRHEILLLSAFTEAILKATMLAGHNIKSFDAPYITRRMWANGLPIPKALNAIGKKPWDVSMVDTMEMWASTDLRYRCSLDLICSVLGIESPKQDLSGTDIGNLYWGMFEGLPEDQLPFEKEQEVLKKIGNYCNGDVLATAQVYCKLLGLPLIKSEQITYL